jgi:hypothetical protein
MTERRFTLKEISEAYWKVVNAPDDCDIVEIRNILAAQPEPERDRGQARIAALEAERDSLAHRLKNLHAFTNKLIEEIDGLQADVDDNYSGNIKQSDLDREAKIKNLFTKADEIAGEGREK